MNQKESITLYVPKTMEAAKKLFKKFKEMNLENLDEELFLHQFEKGEGEIGFCVNYNTWQVCDPKSNLFNITVIEM